MAGSINTSSGNGTAGDLTLSYKSQLPISISGLITETGVKGGNITITNAGGGIGLGITSTARNSGIDLSGSTLQNYGALN
ncbi:hypothetical protein ACXYUI_27955, partial [Klebsiella pneumoniae]